MAYQYRGDQKGDADPWQGEEPEPVPGLYYDARRRKWRARIVYQGKPRSLGTFDDRESAAAAIREERDRIQATDPTWPHHAPRPHRKNREAA